MNQSFLLYRCNLNYICAAIELNTGIKVPPKELAEILVEEGMISRKDVKYLLFEGYSLLHDGVVDAKRTD